MKIQDIKFKAKLVDGGRWVYGSLIVWPDGEVYILHDTDYKETGTLRKDPVQTETVCMCTGLKDRNGKDIYTDDVIKNDMITTFVQYNPKDGFSFGLPIFIMKPEAVGSVEVVGNVHDEDNPLIAKE